MRKVYDCFQFFNELEILEIRLNELDSEVDHFVIVEAELSHQLKPKPLYFYENRKRYSKFLHKIIHVVVPANEFKENDFHHNDQLQRRKITEGIVNANPQDLIMISDLDEIVSNKALKSVKDNYKDGQAFIFEQNLYFWYLNSQAKHYIWRNAGICSKEIVDRIGTQSFKCNARCEAFPRIKNGGWHFSYIGTPDKVKTKIDNFAHGEFNYVTVDNLKNYKENLTDPLGRTNEGINLVVVPIDTMPEYVQKNIDKFKDFIK
jgi:beta-1,4-mannosyl-glycoprotein beta-1,4-N-acetylglucosaminyltransferase